MINLDLTADQLNDLLRHNHCKIDVNMHLPIFQGDTVQAGERVCHVRAVSDNPHWPTKTVYLTMGCGL